MELELIVAMTPGRVIGQNGQLPWHYKEELQYFKRMTMGKTMVMGRKTFNSLGNKTLPGRRSIVITSSDNYNANCCDFVKSWEQAYSLLKNINESPIIIGGEQIYKLSMPYVKKMYITEIYKDYPGDSFFPEVDYTQWKLIDREPKEEFAFCSYSKI